MHGFQLALILAPLFGCTSATLRNVTVSATDVRFGLAAIDGAPTPIAASDGALTTNATTNGTRYTIAATATPPNATFPSDSPGTESQNVSQNAFLPPNNFTYTGGDWVNSTDPVPNCIAGDELSLNTLGSPTGDMLSVSINGGEPELFDLTTPSLSCLVLNLSVKSSMKRSLGPRGKSDAENECTCKNAGGSPVLGGVNYRKAAFGTRLCAGTVLPALVVAASLFVAEFI
ncbi:hypothetical protein C8J57DRAFT_1509131 [Mycena rebaudengoi]|nr:hypothetical protein C8J57DRAFT_1509131 [Mycena rebaudengoi]